MNDLVSNSRVNSDDVWKRNSFLRELLYRRIRQQGLRTGDLPQDFFPFLTQRVDKAS